MDSRTESNTVGWRRLARLLAPTAQGEAGGGDESEQACGWLRHGGSADGEIIYPARSTYRDRAGRCRIGSGPHNQTEIDRGRIIQAWGRHLVWKHNVICEIVEASAIHLIGELKFTRARAAAGLSPTDEDILVASCCDRELKVVIHGPIVPGERIQRTVA